LAPEGMNAIVFGERWGRNQKTTACSEAASGVWHSFFFCVLAPEGMNAIVFGKERGKRTEGCGLF